MQKQVKINPIEFFGKGLHQSDGITSQQRKAMQKWIDECQSPEQLKKTSKMLLLAFTGASRLVERYISMAYKDPGTGIFNRRYFYENLDASLARKKMNDVFRISSQDKQAEETQDVILMIDLVGLSVINKMGQSAGDAALKAIADKLQSNVREGEVASRIGGDEFAVIAREDADDLAFIQNIIRRFQHDLKDLTFEYEGQTYPVEVYIAAYPIDPNLDAEDNMKFVGKELAAAKKRDGIARDLNIFEGPEPKA